jgi:RimJ/RimL family protein N-acetyltransferase
VTAPVLQSERIILRPHRVSDFELLAALYRTKRSEFIGGPLSRDDVWRNFAADVGHWPLRGYGAWAIEDKASGGCIGQVELHWPIGYPERELGWLLFEKFEGQGFASEAASCARDFAFGQLGWSTMVSYVATENRRSISLVERLGATLDKGAPTPNDDPDILVYRHQKA